MPHCSKQPCPPGASRKAMVSSSEFGDLGTAVCRRCTHALDSEPGRNRSVLLHLFGLWIEKHRIGYAETFGPAGLGKKTDEMLLRAEACARERPVVSMVGQCVGSVGGYTLFWEGMLGEPSWWIPTRAGHSPSLYSIQRHTARTCRRFPPLAPPLSSGRPES